jgi:carbon starvation protein
VRLGLFAAARDLADKLAAGVLPPERAAVAPQLIFNQRLDAWLAMLFTAILWFVIIDMARICLRRLRGMPLLANSEVPYCASRLQAAVGEGTP